MNFLDPNNIGKTYKDFILLSIDDLPDYKTKAVYLRHKQTGLEIYHVLAEDKENLFAFAFRTVSKDSLGTAHIMEHSTLCGSEKYPLKEPFNTLASTSLNTFLNALTYPDKTVYPGASVVKSDYFNMLDVYADSVFFPKLDYKTFIQEGHRLEIEEDGKLSIQGVVYNEMKGNYSSFGSVAYSELIGAMYPDSFPAFDSGGDPLEIPNLTYEEFLEFHQKFYNPDNCLLFLYGDIPTSEQIDFFDEKFMGRIKEKYGCRKELDNAESKLPLIKDEIKKLQILNLNKESKILKKVAPETGSTGSCVTVNWYSGQSDIEKYFLSEVLFGSDSSPVSLALKESGLGDEDECGNFGQFREEFFHIGLWGVKPGNEKKVFELVEKTINDIYEKGISQDDIDAAVMGIDFSLREVNRYFGPPSIQIMEKTMKGWSIGKACNSNLTPITSFERVKKCLKEDKDYTKKLIKKYFIDNKIQIKVIVEPSESYFEERNKKEAEFIEKIQNSSNFNKDKLKKELDELHAYQQHIETPEETACIPSTKISELDKNISFPKTELKFVKGADNSDIPVFVSKESTNGIFYIEVLYPFDTLEPKYLKYVPFCSNVITNLGWNGKTWDECITESGCIMGDIWGRLCVGFLDDSKTVAEVEQKYSHYNFMGRQWIGISGKALTSKASETLKLITEIITKMDFSDEKRFEQILQELKAEKKFSFISTGREYALKRVKTGTSAFNTMLEIFWGISSLKTISEFTKENIKETLMTFEYIYSECRKNGGIIHIVADEDSLNSIMPQIEDFAKKTELTKLKPLTEKYTIESLMAYVYEGDACVGNFAEQDIKEDSQTGYAVALSDVSNAGTKEAFGEVVLTSWFTMHSLWDKIRTTGGAYGAGAVSDNRSKNLLITSYRDPNPQNSIKVFKEALKELCEIVISAEDIEKTKVSCYGDVIVPQSAKARGSESFEKFLYGVTPENRIKNVNMLLEVTPEEVMEAAKRLAANCDKVYRTAVFCDKAVQTCGKNIKMPL